jgi:cytochrome c553
MKNIFASVAVLFAAAISCNAFAGGDIDAGKAAVQSHNCAACHGANLSTPIDPSYPKLAGQHADYIVHALTAYKRGGDGPNGRSNAIMGAQAKPLSDKDMQDIAAYIHNLPGTLVVSK